MTRETRSLLARRHLGDARLGEFVDWAVSLLEAGADTPHLRMLASLDRDSDAQDIAYYFGQVLDELGWSAPPPEQLLREYARDLAQDILEGALSPGDGCHQIYGIHRELNGPDDLRAWLYLDDEMDPDTDIYVALKGEEWEAAIRREARRFVQRSAAWTAKDQGL